MFNCFNTLYMKTILYLVLALLLALVFSYVTTPWLNTVGQVVTGAALLTVFAAVYRKLER